MTYQFTDIDGDELIIEPIGRHGRPAISLRTKRSDTHQGAAVHLTPAQAEDVITAIRTTLHQAPGSQPPPTGRAATLREAADRINALPQDYECDPGRGDAAELLRRMADEAQQ